MQAKKGILHTLTIAAFACQLAHFAYFYTRASRGFAILFIFSIVAHFLYYKRAIKEGKKQFKTHFFYYEIAVGLLQAFMVFSFPIALANWIMTIPLVVQAVTCIVLHVFDEKTDSGLPFHNEVISDREDDQFKKKVAFYDFPIVHRISSADEH